MFIAFASDCPNFINPKSGNSEAEGCIGQQGRGKLGIIGEVQIHDRALYKLKCQVLLLNILDSLLHKLLKISFVQAVVWEAKG